MGIWAFPSCASTFAARVSARATHDGKAETGDVLAALDWLENEFHLPLIVAGFSFGAAMALQACCGPQKTAQIVRALVALGLPTHADGHDYHYRFLHDCAIPKLFLSGDRDAFAPAAQLAARLSASAADPKRLVLHPRRRSFFYRSTGGDAASLAGWLKEQFFMTPASDAALGNSARHRHRNLHRRLKACNIASAFDRRTPLRRQQAPSALPDGSGPDTIDLAAYKRIFVIAIGKAAGPCSIPCSTA